MGMQAGAMTCGQAGLDHHVPLRNRIIPLRPVRQKAHPFRFHTRCQSVSKCFQSDVMILVGMQAVSNEVSPHLRFDRGLRRACELLPALA